MNSLIASKPKVPTSISSRELLRSSLGIESFAASVYKSQGTLPSTIELLADYVTEMSKQVGAGKIGGNNWGEMDAKQAAPTRRAAPKAVEEEEEAEISMEAPQGGGRGRATMPHPSHQRPSAVPAQGFAPPLLEESMSTPCQGEWQEYLSSRTRRTSPRLRWGPVNPRLRRR